MKTIEVVAAVIHNNNKILCVQRPENKLDYISKKYEFPGGKIEKNESLEDALKRELKEELNIEEEIGEFLIKVEHDYPDFKLIMHSFIVEVDYYDIKLNEHINYKWLNKNELLKLDWAAADIPIIKKLNSNG